MHTFFNTNIGQCIVFIDIFFIINRGQSILFFNTNTGQCIVFIDLFLSLIEANVYFFLILIQVNVYFLLTFFYR